MSSRGLGRTRTAGWLVLGLTLALPVLAAANVVDEDALVASSANDGTRDERWVLAFDNDFLVPGGRDQDYTYGVSLSHQSRALAKTVWWAPLHALDETLGLRKATKHSVELGLYGFTPEDIDRADANTNDRPYASLVYVSARNERLYPLTGTVVRSQLSLGMLGLDWVGDLQKSLHSVIDSKNPAGWRHQVSAGGEPTARYSLARQQLLLSEQSGLEVKRTHAVSLGYITEASWGMSFRAGRFTSAWHSFNPDLASYLETAAQINDNRREAFWWGGFAFKARAYNAFLQGQFAPSAVTYDFTELEHFIMEVWLGYTQGFANGVFVSYGMRGHSSEIRAGAGNRNVLWGGLVIGRNV